MIAHRLLETEKRSDAAIIFLGQIPIQFCGRSRLLFMAFQ